MASRRVTGGTTMTNTNRKLVQISGEIGGTARRRCQGQTAKIGVLVLLAVVCMFIGDAESIRALSLYHVQFEYDTEMVEYSILDTSKQTGHRRREGENREAQGIDSCLDDSLRMFRHLHQ